MSIYAYLSTYNKYKIKEKKIIKDNTVLLGIVYTLVNLLQTNAWLDLGNNESSPTSIHGKEDLTRMEQTKDALGRTHLHSVESGPGNRLIGLIFSYCYIYFACFQHLTYCTVGIFGLEL